MLKYFYFIFLALLFPTWILAEQIDINSATLSRLDQLTGIGPVYAQRIIDGRPYSSIDDLLKVKGIGPATLQKIKDQGWACINCEAEQQTQETQQMQQVQQTPATTINYPSGVTINEILPSATGDDEINEWIEIYNSNNTEIDLSGWSIRDAEGTATTYTIPIGTKLTASGYLVLTRPLTKIILNNSGDKIELLQPNNNITDSVTYPIAITGQSYNKTNNGWTWSATLTPGAVNIIKAANITTTKIKSNTTERPAEQLTKADINGISDEQMTAGLEQPVKNLRFAPLLIIGLITAIISTAIFFIIKTKKIKT